MLFRSIVNVTNPALPKDEIWTGAYQDNELRVDVTAETGYQVKITAVDSAGNNVPVQQVGVAGVVTGYLTMADKDITITVLYTKDELEDIEYDLTLKVDDPAQLATNKAQADDAFGNHHLEATGALGTDIDIEQNVTAGTDFQVTTNAANGYYAEKTELTANGVTVTVANEIGRAHV